MQKNYYNWAINFKNHGKFWSASAFVTLFMCDRTSLGIPNTYICYYTFIAKLAGRKVYGGNYFLVIVLMPTVAACY